MGRGLVVRLQPCCHRYVATELSCIGSSFFNFSLPTPGPRVPASYCLSSSHVDLPAGVGLRYPYIAGTTGALSPRSHCLFTFCTLPLHCAFPLAAFALVIATLCFGAIANHLLDEVCISIFRSRLGLFFINDRFFPCPAGPTRACAVLVVGSTSLGVACGRDFLSNGCICDLHSADEDLLRARQCVGNVCAHPSVWLGPSHTLLSPEPHLRRPRIRLATRVRLCPWLDPPCVCAR